MRKNINIQAWPDKSCSGLMALAMALDGPHWPPTALDGPPRPRRPPTAPTAHTNIFSHFIFISSSVFNIFKKENNLKEKIF